MPGSACSMPPSVSSENTTPKPNVSSGAFRSHTVISCRGSSCLARAAKYRPPGPPPSTAIRIWAVPSLHRPGWMGSGYVVIDTTVKKTIYSGEVLTGRRVIRRSVAIERINPAELGRPSGFSHVVSVTSGRLAFLAGQTALDADGQIAAAGGQPADLVSVTIYLVDLDDYRAHGREIGEVWRRLAGREYPAMAAIGV